MSIDGCAAGGSKSVYYEARDILSIEQAFGICSDETEDVVLVKNVSFSCIT
jgi:hypothetical protein